MVMVSSKSAIFTAILLFVTTFSGCTNDEQELFSSLAKISKAKTHERVSHISFEVNYSGEDEYFQSSMKSIKNVFDNLEFNLSQKYEGDTENNKFKAFLNSETALDPVKISADLWMDLDIGAQNPKYQFVVRIPAVIKGFLPDEYNKEYLNIDYIKYLDFMAEESGVSNLSFAEVLITSADMKKQFMNVLSAMKLNETLGGDFVKSSKTYDGMDKLTLTLTDEQLKSVILAFLTEMKTNEALLNQLTGLFGSYLYTYNDNQVDGDVEQQIPLGIDEVVQNIEEYFNDNTILGSKGIVYEVVLDKDGYITTEVAVIHICMNTNDAPYRLGTFSYNDDGSYNDGKVEIITTIRSEYSNINEKSSINFPQLTDGNSIDYVSFLQTEAAEQKEWQKYYFPSAFYYDSLEDVNETPVEFPIKGIYKDKQISSAIEINKPEDGYCFYMPLEQAVGLFGGDIAEGDVSDSVIWTVDGKTIIVAYKNMHEWMTENDISYDTYCELDDTYLKSGYTNDSVVFVSMEAIEDVLGIDFGYDENISTILLK